MSSRELNQTSKTLPLRILYLSAHPLRPSATVRRPHATMRWPPWSSNPRKDQDDTKERVAWTDSLNATDWSHYTDPRTLVPTLLLTTTTLVLVHVYRSYLRRIPEAANIQPEFFRRRSLFGRVTSVGDGDNFRIFHTPGGRLFGWGWFPGRRVPEKREDLKDRTVRLCHLATLCAMSLLRHPDRC